MKQDRLNHWKIQFSLHWISSWLQVFLILFYIHFLDFLYLSCMSDTESERSVNSGLLSWANCFSTIVLCSLHKKCSKCEQIRHLRRIWSHLQEKFLMENFIFCAVVFKCDKQASFEEQYIYLSFSSFLSIICDRLGTKLCSSVVSLFSWTLFPSLYLKNDWLILFLYCILSQKFIVFIRQSISCFIFLPMS